MNTASASKRAAAAVGAGLPPPTSELLARGTPTFRRLSVSMLLAGIATFAVLYGVQPMLPTFVAAFGVSVANASLAVSLATGAMALVLIPAGILSDRLGRVPVMLTSLFGASILTMVSATLPGWGTLLVMRLLTGVALGGIPAIAMAYVAEEVDAASVGSAMGLYIAGSAFGGMVGRLGVSLLAEYCGWRWALGCVGAASLGCAALFWWLAPASRGFEARRHNFASLASGLRTLLRDAALPWLYAEGFLLMGAFVTIYNYIGFRLLAPPYSLRPGTVGLVFLLYLLGSVSSALVGGVAGRVGRRRVFWMPIGVLLIGVGLTAAGPLTVVIFGIAAVTVGFFGAHSIASSWVGRRGGGHKGLASSLYLLFYYLGSSILGSAGGVAWSSGGWHTVALFVGTVTVVAAAGAWQLAGIRPMETAS